MLQKSVFSEFLFWVIFTIHDSMLRLITSKPLILYHYWSISKLTEFDLVTFTLNFSLRAYITREICTMTSLLQLLLTQPRKKSSFGCWGRAGELHKIQQLSVRLGVSINWLILLSYLGSASLVIYGLQWLPHLLEDYHPHIEGSLIVTIWP